MSKLAPPSTLYDIRPGHTGTTEEWGRIIVVRMQGGTVWFEATGGRGEPGVHSHTRSYLFHSTKWDKTMIEWETYRSKRVTYFTPWHPGFDMDGVVISKRIWWNGGPKEGDMIAQYFDPDEVDDVSNIQDHEWKMRVVTKEEFHTYYEMVEVGYSSLEDRVI